MNKTVFLLVLCLFTTWHVQAEDKVIVDAQLQQLFKVVETNNPLIQVATAKQQAALSAEAVARSDNEVEVRLKSELGYFAMEKKDFFRTANQVRASYPLYQPDKVDLVNIAAYRVSAADWQLESQRQDLLKKLANSYYQYWIQQAQFEFLQKERGSIEEIMAQIEQRFQVGYQDLDDIAEVQARLDVNLAELLLAEQKLQVTLADIEAIVGEPIDLQAMTVPQQLPKLAQEFQQDRQQHRLKTGIDHPKLLALKAANKAIESRTDYERNREGIQVEAYAAYVYNDSDGNFYDDAKGVRGGVQLSLPLYQAGRTEAKVAQVRAEAQQLKHKITDVKLMLAAESRKSQLVYKAGVKRLASLNSALYSSQQALKATENGLQTGSRNILDLLNAQRRVHQSEREIPIVKATIWQAWYSLKWAQGKL